MPMTIVVTNNVAPRFRGYLASVMLEIAPGVYTGPRMSSAVRKRVWAVIEDWYNTIHSGATATDTNASIIMTWRDREAVGGQSIHSVGVPQKTLVDADGVLLVKREVVSVDTT